MIEQKELVLVYAAIVEMADEKKERDPSDIFNEVELDNQKVKIVLDELEHMGFIEKRDGMWRPKI